MLDTRMKYRRISPASPIAYEGYEGTWQWRRRGARDEATATFSTGLVVNFHRGRVGMEPWADSNGPDWTGGFYVRWRAPSTVPASTSIILEDTCMVSEVLRQIVEASFKHAVFAPKHDPMPLVPLIAVQAMIAPRHRGDDVRRLLSTISAGAAPVPPSTTSARGPLAGTS